MKQLLAIGPPEISSERSSSQGELSSWELLQEQIIIKCLEYPEFVDSLDSSIFNIGAVRSVIFSQLAKHKSSVLQRFEGTPDYSPPSQDLRIAPFGVGYLDDRASVHYTTNKLDKIGGLPVSSWTATLLDKQFYEEYEGINRLLLAFHVVAPVDGVDVANRFLHCSEQGRAIKCDCCSNVKRFRPMGCGHRLCIVCSYRRERILRHKYWKMLCAMREPKLLTLTVGPVPVDYPDILSFWRTRVAYFVKLLRRAGYPIRSAVIVPELAEDMHLHFHVIIDVPWLDQAWLCEQWFKATQCKDHSHQGRYVVYIQKASPKKAMTYITKYTCKPPSYDSTREYQSYAILVSNRRLLSTIGAMYNIEKITAVILEYCKFCDGQTGNIYSMEIVRATLEVMLKFNSVP
jgi:hypothetical protein